LVKVIVILIIKRPPRKKKRPPRKKHWLKKNTKKTRVFGSEKNTKKCFSHLGSHAIDHKRWRLASWGHGDEATAMAARAAYAVKNVNITVFRIGQGAGPKPISNEKFNVNVHIL